MAPLFALDGRSALVSGVGSPDGIGIACARLLGGQGARLVVTATSERVLERADELRAEGLDVVGLTADLTDVTSTTALVSAATRQLGTISILVNNAGMVQSGVSIPGGTLVEQPAYSWARQLEITLMTAVNLTRLVIPQMRAAHHGRIVMMSSVTGPLVSAAGSSAYSAAKGGIDGLMRAVAIEEGPHGITCSSVAPGWIRTSSSEPDELLAGVHTPVGRPGTPEEVAAMVVFLASDEASYVTGQSYIVDGGNTIQEIKGS